MASGAIPPLVQTIVVQGANAIPQAMAAASASVKQAEPLFLEYAQSLKATSVAATEAAAANVKVASSASSAATQVAQAAAVTQVAIQTQSEALTSAGVKFNSTDARVGMQAGLREIGITGNRALTRLVSQSQTLGPIMASAFPVIGALAAVQVIGMLVDKIEEASSAMMGWDEAAKKTMADVEESSRAAYQHMIKMVEAEEKLTTIGLQGIPKVSAELKNNATDQKRWNAEIERTGTEIATLTTALEKYSHKSSEIAAASTGMVGVEDVSPSTMDSIQAEQAQKTLEALQKENQQYRDNLDEAKIKEKELAKDRVLTANATAIAILDVRKQTQEAIIAGELQEMATLRSLGALTLEEAIRKEQALVARKLEIDRKYIQDRAALSPEGSTARSTAGVDVARAEQEAQNRKNEIASRGMIESRRNEAANAKAIVESERAVSEATFRSEQESIIALASAKKIGYEQERSDLLASLDKRIAAETAEKQKDIENAKKFNADDTALQTTLQGELAAIGINGATARSRINMEVNRKIEEADKAATELSKREAEQRLRDAQRLADLRLAVETQSADRLLKLNRVSIDQWATKKQTALNRWHETEIGNIEESQRLMKAMGLQDTEQYRHLIEQRIQLNEKWKNESLKVSDAVAQHWHSVQLNAINQINGALRSAITGADTFYHAFAQVFDNLILDAAQYFLKLAEMNALHWTIQKIQDITGWGVKASTDAAGAATGAAIRAATNTATIIGDAAVAAAGAFAAIAPIPFVGPFLAPEAAAAAEAAVLSFVPQGTFAQGGLVPKDMVAQVHKGEGIFSEPTMNMLDHAAAGGGFGGETHHHYQLTYHAGPNNPATPEQLFSRMKRAARNNNMSFGSAT